MPSVWGFNSLSPFTFLYVLFPISSFHVISLYHSFNSVLELWEWYLDLFYREKNIKLYQNDTGSLLDYVLLML